MINAITKIQKTANVRANAIALNASLPVSIEVAAKTGFNRYILKFANRELSTKSQRPLKVGGQYWGEIAQNQENIVIQNLYEKPNFSYASALKEGLNLIEKIINESNLEWLYEYIFQNLATTEDKNSFEIYQKMLLALQKNILHVPFFYEGNFGLFELKKGEKQSEIYLMFSNFAPLNFMISGGYITRIITPFGKVAAALKDAFDCEILIGSPRQMHLTTDIKG